MRLTDCPRCGQAVRELGGRGGALFNVNPTAAHPLHHYTCKDPDMALFAQPTNGTPDVPPSQGDLEKIRRDRNGRPYIRQPDGKEVTYQRVTTFIKPLEDEYHLTLWKMRQTATGLSLRQDLARAVDAHTPGYLEGDDNDKSTLNELCKQAMEAAGSQGKANLGTALHRLTERYDRGQLTVSDAPAWARDDLRAYAKATEPFRWQHIERMHVHDDLKVAGTPDRVGNLNDDGAPFIADLKTGSMYASSCAAQLGVYANSSLYDLATGERTPTRYHRTVGLIIHLPAGSGVCRIRKVDIAAGWQAASSIAPALHAWRRNRSCDLGEWWPPNPDTPPLDLAAAAQTARTLNDLLALHQQAVAAGAWTDDLKALFTARRRALDAPYGAA